MIHSSKTLRLVLLSAALMAGASTAHAAGDAEKGRVAFATNGCWSCHGYQGQGGASGARIGVRPPALAGFKAFVRMNKTDMPAYSAKVLPDATLEDIHAYLSSIPAPPNPDTIPLLKD